MANPHPNAHTLTLTPERLATATSWLSANAEGMRRVSRDARILAAVALLACDEVGYVSKASLLSAMRDPEAVSAAELLVSAVV